MPRTFFSQLTDQELYGLPENYVAEYRARVSAVTLADVRRVVPRWFPFADLLVLVLADPDEVVGQLHGLGSLAIRALPD